MSEANQTETSKREPFDFAKYILARGEHAGTAWIVAHNGLGYRTGYALLPEGHRWKRLGYDDIPVEVHGGLTYQGDRLNDGDEWIGFDCAHAGDAQDPELMAQSDDGVVVMRSYGQESVRSQEYVESEAKSLCEQIRDKADEPVSCPRCEGRGFIA